MLHQEASRVKVWFDIDVPLARWQIHELPVDFSIDPKLRCTPEHVGHVLYLQFSSRDGEYIYNVTTTSLVMHSMIILVNDTPVTCGTIIPDSAPELPPTLVMFKSGVFGRIYSFYWPCEYNIILHKVQHRLKLSKWIRNSTYVNCPY